MDTTRLGRTDLIVTRTGFGCLPLQRVEMNEAIRIVRAAYDGGITFFDTARAYTDSEEKLGRALGDVRDKVVIATKSTAKTRSGVISDLETSLRELGADYVDLMQLHNPKEITTLRQAQDAPDPESAYAGLIEARDKGMTRFIGITNHVRERAAAAIDSGMYDTLQYPMCHISAPEDLALIDRCRARDMAMIGMKSLCGGLITKLPPAFAFLRQYPNLIPIWGIQRMSELEELLALDRNPPALNDAMWKVIETDRRELADEFCRACGYCLPCPQGIPIPMASRMGLLLKRMPWQGFMTADWHEKMHRVENCTDCGACRSRCPYGIDPPAMLKKGLVEYEEFWGENAGAGAG